MINGKKIQYYLHRFIMGLPAGEGIDSEKTVDHINRFKYDNSEANLRIATQFMQNMIINS